MSLPELDDEGYLPPGLHAAPLGVALTRFGGNAEARQRQAELLRQVVTAATAYSEIKRVLVWGSFVTAKPEPGDLDYSIVVSVGYQPEELAGAHRRFFVPFDARMYYGVDRGFLVIRDYPLEDYIEQIDFMCHTRRRQPRGVVEISVRGEVVGETT